MSEVLIKQIKPKAKAEPKQKPEAKAEAKQKPEAKAEAKQKPEAKVEAKPKAKEPKAEKPVIIREIIKHIPKQKRQASEYNKFIGQFTRGTGKSFTEATTAWKEHKAKSAKSS